jgi:hypothetical protein
MRFPNLHLMSAPRLGSEREPFPSYEQPPGSLESAGSGSQSGDELPGLPRVRRVRQVPLGAIEKSCESPSRPFDPR